MPLGFYYSPPDEHQPDYRTANHARVHRVPARPSARTAEQLRPGGHGLVRRPRRTDADSGCGKALRDDPPAPAADPYQQPLPVSPADFDTPEQTIGGFQINRPWESCITICNQWAWKPDDR